MAIAECTAILQFKDSFMSTSYIVRGSVAVLTLDNPPVNGLSFATRQGVAAGLERAQADAAVNAVVITGAGKAFSGGADIKEFDSPKALAEPNLRTLISMLEDCSKPVVAAIHSVCMGGGLELALGCHYRVSAPGANVALPEVKLGLVPGAGGTQRLPRVLGVETALNMIVTGDSIKSETLAALPGQNLFDRIIEGELLAGAIAFALERADLRPLPQVRQLKATHPNADAYFQFARNTVKSMFKNFPAPARCIDCVEQAVKAPRIEDGCLYERSAFISLIGTPESKALRHAFFGERAASKIADVPDNTPLRVIKAVAVIGAGTMGGGISMNFLNAGIPVTIVETSAAALERGLGVIRKNYETTAKRGRLTMEDVEKRMGLLTGSLEMTDLGDADLIIEAVFENMDIKKEVFGKLDAIAKPGAILASNTSYLNVDEIAGATGRPESVIGLHFFSPANVMRLLEVVRGDATSKSVIATSMQIAKKIGKIAALVGVCHGFVGNRMLSMRQRQAQAILLEGAMPWDIDRVLYDFGFPMGPFAMSDLAGLDIGWNKETSKGETLRDQLCELDRRGQKTGAGFYDYDEARNAKPSPVTADLIEKFRAAKGVNVRSFTDEEIIERCIYPMINEGAKILQEGKASRASDIDIVWINGYGWPVYRGGPMFYGDTVGLKKVVESLTRLAKEMCDEWAPFELLVKTA